MYLLVVVHYYAFKHLQIWEGFGNSRFSCGLLYRQLFFCTWESIPLNFLFCSGFKIKHIVSNKQTNKKKHIFLGKYKIIRHLPISLERYSIKVFFKVFNEDCSPFTQKKV